MLFYGYLSGYRGFSRRSAASDRRMMRFGIELFMARKNSPSPEAAAAGLQPWPARFPAWTDFPAIPLYKDQVIYTLTEFVRPLYLAETPVTASMINNYVKLRMLPPPVNKKYDRAQMATLFLIFLFKQAFTAEEMCQLLSIGADCAVTQERYTRVLGMFEDAMKLVFEGPAAASVAALQTAHPKDGALWAAACAMANKLFVTAALSAPVQKGK